MDTKDKYQKLFATRKWTLALSFLPLDSPTESKVSKAGDLLSLRSRASDFTKRSEDRKASVSLDFENKTATITITKK